MEAASSHICSREGSPSPPSQPAFLGARWKLRSYTPEGELPSTAEVSHLTLSPEITLWGCSLSLIFKTWFVLFLSQKKKKKKNVYRVQERKRETKRSLLHLHFFISSFPSFFKKNFPTLSLNGQPLRHCVLFLKNWPKNCSTFYISFSNHLSHKVRVPAPIWLPHSSLSCGSGSFQMPQLHLWLSSIFPRRKAVPVCGTQFLRLTVPLSNEITSQLLPCTLLNQALSP